MSSGRVRTAQSSSSSSSSDPSQSSSSSESPTSSLASAQAVLNHHWRYQRFRHHQRKAILAALGGRDCLAILPTGGGKSLCYQVPAMMLPGVTVVVSPLISLMQDQVAALRSRGLPAAYVSSTQRPATQRAVWEAVRAKQVKLLYVAPERLPQVPQLMRGIPVALLAVDEAHCISEWGHEFRPHYRAIGRHRHLMGSPPTMAVTATATPATRQDIVRVLGLRRPVRVLQSFDRPTLSFEVQRVRSDQERMQRMEAQVRATTETVIVYVRTRNRTDGVATRLRQCGVATLPYHAGLPGRARRALLSRFLNGRCRVMVATSAFGMGIDKSDVRLVVHVGVPSRPETYYQEAGRAGRDGVPSRCVLLWSEGDLELAARMSRVGQCESGSQRQHQAAERGLEAMRRYVRSRRCRRRMLLEYLGERLDACAGCDRCGGHAS
ncbi:MAG: RecQ family ATP-dependent DNA helicase [Gemmatimonadota bacterium]|nr:RecQ family ATP-dependent DNA helicase [Gemmatimonadota bacterium]